MMLLGKISIPNIIHGRCYFFFFFTRIEFITYIRYTKIEIKIERSTDFLRSNLFKFKKN